MDYNIYTVTPANYPHSRCFEELSLGLAAGLRELGHSATETTVLSDIHGRAIVLGAHLIPDCAGFPGLPGDAIIYNTEVVQPECDWITPEYLELLKRHTVWDYSTENVENWKRHGVNAIYCGIGFHEVLQRIEPAPVQDIDVLFYGSMNERRARIINQLIDAGIAVTAVPFGTYGKERDAYIARAKVVLNIHYYEGAPLEMVRVSYLWANRICTLLIDKHTDLVNVYDGKEVAKIPYYLLICEDFVKFERARKEDAKCMHDFFKTHSRQSRFLKSALAETAQAERPQPSAEPHASNPQPSECGEFQHG